MRTLTSELVLPHHTLRNRVIMGSMHTGFEEHPRARNIWRLFTPNAPKTAWR